MKRFAFLLLVALAGCQPPVVPPTKQSEETPAREILGIDYSKWQSVTEKPYEVSPEAYTFCRAPTTGEVHGPHFATSIVVRVNPIGIEQFKAGKSVPVGTVVIKEKYPLFDSKSELVAVAAMIKHEPGYNPEHGDWEYAYEQLKPDAEKKLTRGKLENCIGCHLGKKSSDFLFRPYLKELK